MRSAHAPAFFCSSCSSLSERGYGGGGGSAYFAGCVCCTSASLEPNAENMEGGEMTWQCRSVIPQKCHANICPLCSHLQPQLRGCFPSPPRAAVAVQGVHRTHDAVKKIMFHRKRLLSLQEGVSFTEIPGRYQKSVFIQPPPDLEVLSSSTQLNSSLLKKIKFLYSPTLLKISLIKLRRR